MATSIGDKSRKTSVCDEVGGRERSNSQFTAIFEEATECIEAGNSIVAKFRLTLGHYYSVEDTIRLYEVGWKSLGDSLSKNSVILPNGYQCGTDQLISVVLPNVPLDSDKLYQLCYVSRNSKILGVTKPFKVLDSACSDSASSKGDDDFVEVEEDGAFLIVKSRNQLLEARLSQVSFQKVQVEQQLRIAVLENNDLHIRVRELLAAKTDLEARYASLAYDLNAASEKYREKAVANSELQSRLDGLETDRNALQRRFEEQEAELLTIQKRLDLKNVEIETTREQLRCSEAERSRLTDQLSVLRRDSDFIQLSYAAARGEATALQAECEAARQKCASAESKLGILKSELEESHRNLDSSSNDIERLEKALADRENQFTHLRAERDHLESRYKLCNEQCDELVAQLSAVQERTRLISTECRSAKDQLADAERRIGELETVLEEATQKLWQANETCKTIREERDSCQRLLEEAVRTRDLLDNQLAVTLDAKRLLEAELAEAKVARCSLEKSLTETEDHRCELAERVDRCELTIRQYVEKEHVSSDKYGELEAIISAKQKDLDDTDCALSALRVSFEAIESRLAKANANNEALRRELDASLRVNAELVSDLDSLREENIEVHRTNLELIQKLRAARAHYEQTYRECKKHEKRLWKRSAKVSSPSARDGCHGCTDSLTAELYRLRLENEQLRSRLKVAVSFGADDASVSQTNSMSECAASPIEVRRWCRNSPDACVTESTQAHLFNLPQQPMSANSNKMRTAKAVNSHESEDAAELHMHLDRTEYDFNDDEWYDEAQPAKDDAKYDVAGPEAKRREESDDDPELSAIQSTVDSVKSKKVSRRQGDGAEGNDQKSDSADEYEEQPPLNLDPPLKPLPPPIEPELVRSGRPSTTLSHSFSNLSDSESDEFLDAAQGVRAATRSARCVAGEANGERDGEHATSSFSDTASSSASSSFDEQVRRDYHVYRSQRSSSQKDNIVQDYYSHANSAKATASSGATLYSALQKQLNEVQMMANPGAIYVAMPDGSFVPSSQVTAADKQRCDVPRSGPQTHATSRDLPPSPVRNTNPFLNEYASYPHPGVPTFTSIAAAATNIATPQRAETVRRECPICGQKFSTQTAADQIKFEQHVDDHLD